MAFEYRIYLDDTELTDLPDGLDNFGLTVIRESGVTSDEQVLRVKTEVEFTFWGDGYAYICAAKQANYCNNINVRIYMLCGDYSRLAFIGILPLVGTVTDVTRRTIKARIRDNSFSGYIRERQGNKVFLTSTNSANGTSIPACPTRTISFFDSAGTYNILNRDVYDAYEVLKYMVRYLSDNTVSVVSDYFTSGAGYNKYAITMGGMLYGGNAWTSQASLPTYFTPNVSFQEVFRELRKKLRLYMSIDTDSNGNATIRFEPEAYFYSQTLLKAVDGIPFDLVEDYDIETVYSEIKVGSSETKVDDGTYYTYPKLQLYSFENETYNSCSDCVEENSLDLVSEWIIDSNVIHFTLDQGNSTSPPDFPPNVANGNRVFLIETDITTDTATKTLYGSDYFYNNLLTNDKVLTNWAGGIPECVSRYLITPCLDACAEDIAYGSGAGSSNVDVELTNVTCGSPIFTEQFNFSINTDTFNDITTYMLIPESGDYSFQFSTTFESQNSDAAVAIKCYIMESSANLTSGNNEQANLVNSFFDVYTLGTTETKTLVINTGVLSLTAGNVIFFGYTTLQITGTTVLTNICAELVYTDVNQTLQFVSDDYLRKPLRWTFTDDLCDTDFINILADKTGYWSVNGQQGWIKQIDYNPDRTSTITLQAINTLCC